MPAPKLTDRTIESLAPEMSRLKKAYQNAALLYRQLLSTGATEAKFNSKAPIEASAQRLEKLCKSLRAAILRLAERGHAVMLPVIPDAATEAAKEAVPARRDLVEEMILIGAPDDIGDQISQLSTSGMIALVTMCKKDSMISSGWTATKWIREVAEMSLYEKLDKVKNGD